MATRAERARRCTILARPRAGCRPQPRQAERIIDTALHSPRATPRPRRAWVSLRVTLLSLVVGLLLFTVLCLTLLYAAAARRTVRELEARYFDAAGDRVASDLRTMLGPAAPILENAAYAGQQFDLLAPANETALVAYLARGLGISDELAQLYYGDADSGRFVAVRREDDGTLVVSRSQPDVNGGRRAEARIAPDGTETPLPSTETASFDPRRRDWYAMASDAAGLVWTPPYHFFANDRLGITAAEPVRPAPGAALRGVLGADFYIDTISAALAALVETPGGQSYLVDRAGQVIATSLDARPAARYPLLDAALASLADSPRSLATVAVDDPISFYFDAAGTTYVGALQAFGLRGGVEWATVYLVPQDEFLASVYENQRTAVLWGLAIALLALAGGIALAHSVARPLRVLAADLERVGRFQLSTRPSPHSPIREVAVLGDSVDRMKASLRSFGRYVPSDLVRDMLARGEEARLGGTQRRLSIHFSDIEGFTRISETLPPAQVVDYLAVYLGLMVGTLREHQGTLDKFMGDGILAFFNAPGDVPDHAAQACRAALVAQARLAALRAEWVPAGRPAFYARIGLHVGDVLVGNFGTDERFSYTVIGDAANLASRLEGLNKEYGTYTMASAELREAAGPGFEWRRLDRVAVVGRQGGTEVAELLGDTGDVNPALLAARDRYEEALDDYFARRFGAAVQGFREAARLRPDDAAAPMMAERADYLGAADPGPRWTGIHILTHK
jgi:adenylate cyclase